MSRMEIAKRNTINNVARVMNPEDAEQARALVRYLDHLEAQKPEVVLGMEMDYESWMPVPLMPGYQEVRHVVESFKRRIAESEGNNGRA